MVVSSSERGEHTAFYPSFPLKESTAKAFGWLFLWNFKEKASTVFYGTAFQKSAPPLRLQTALPYPKAFVWKLHPPVMQDAGAFPIRREIRLHAPAKA
ncbi:MAG: hypothetical protein KH745_09050 [Bilophila sp.]|nr:hypothetical protein [Bilophila sp.]